MGVKPPFANSDVTHGVCRACAERLLREALRRPGQTLIILSRSHHALREHLEALTAGMPNVSVRMDERRGERRQRRERVGADRRRGDRRATPSPSQRAAWQALGVFVVS
jgi:hypothetical protein